MRMFAAGCAALSVGAWAAEPLRLVTDIHTGASDHMADDKAPGFHIDLARQVFASMGQDVEFEYAPTNLAWKLILRGERDGAVGVLRTSEREQICTFADEPLGVTKWVLFVRTADIGKLKFSSFDDLIGHDVAVRGPVPGLFEQPTVSVELWNFLRQHRNMVETNGSSESLRMLAAGRVDYAVVGLLLGQRQVAKMGLSGEIEPLMSRSVLDEGFYVCFAKAHASPALIADFSRVLKQFKQTQAFQELRRKYPPVP